MIKKLAIIIESERGLNEKPLDNRQGRKKVLVPLWAKSATDMQRLEKGDIQQKIEDNYNTWCKHIGFDEKGNRNKYTNRKI